MHIAPFFSSILPFWAKLSGIEWTKFGPFAQLSDHKIYDIKVFWHENSISRLHIIIKIINFIDQIDIFTHVL